MAGQLNFEAEPFGNFPSTCEWSQESEFESSKGGKGGPSAGGGHSGGHSHTHKHHHHHRRRRRWHWLRRNWGGGMDANASWAQSCLAQILGDWVPQDGRMGPGTRRAIRQFQSQQQLPVTGYLDSQTRDQLQDACDGGSDSDGGDGGDGGGGGGF